MRYSPAALALLGHGSTVTALAEALSVGQPTATKYLAGSLRMPETIRTVLGDLIGDEAATEIVGLIPAYTNRPRGAVNTRGPALEGKSSVRTDPSEAA